MKVLGIDTSAVVSACAICEIGENPKVIASGSLNTKLTHSQTLVPFMESLLKGASLTLNDIDVFAVSAGPGSFTGLRIGVSAIKGMAFAQNKPVRAVSTLLGIVTLVRPLQPENAKASMVLAPSIIVTLVSFAHSEKQLQKALTTLLGIVTLVRPLQ